MEAKSLKIHSNETFKNWVFFRIPKFDNSEKPIEYIRNYCVVMNALIFCSEHPKQTQLYKITKLRTMLGDRFTPFNVFFFWGYYPTPK